jgi:hypothetical protein
MDASQLQDWLAAYGSAWVTRDADAAAALFGPDALYHESPYDAPFEGSAGVREYWVSVTEDQGQVDFDSEVVGVFDGSGVALWSARFERTSTGAPVELNGVFLLEFDDQMRCTSLREWWHAR